MRRLYHDQLPLGPSTAQHPRSAELLEMSRLLDAMEAPLVSIRHDLTGCRKVGVKKGREGLSAEQVMRIGIVKQMFGFSYEELAFHLENPFQLRAFCRLSPSASPPKKSALQANIGTVRAKTWQAVNEAVVFEARRRKVEDGRWMRTDATVAIPCICRSCRKEGKYGGKRQQNRPHALSFLSRSWIARPIAFLRARNDFRA
jgi:IS5 family transposase